MPLQCPRCQIAQAEENETCINCGQPLTPAPDAPAAMSADPALLAEAATAPDPVHAVQARRASWRMPALITVGLLLAVAASALLIARRRPPLQGMPTAQAAPAPVPSPDTAPPVPTASPTPPMPVPPEAEARPPVRAKTGAKTAGAKAAVETPPPTVTLVSRSAGRHVQAGDPVTLTAVTEAARGRSATLTLFSRRGRGDKTMITFVEGSLCSTNWTTLVPGRYEFTATAQADSRRTVTSRPVEITVDRPASAAAPLRVAAAPPPPRAVRLPPSRRVSEAVPPKRAARAAPRAEAPAKPPAPAQTYHVAAAQFAFSRSAVVLADALRLRGYPALPERMTDRHGKTVYVVVTGTFRRPKEARAAALALQRSGYPAYFFGGR